MQTNLQLEFPKTYGAYTLDERVRKYSSSGGIFTELAKCVLNKGGFVYGAAYNEEYEVQHIRITNTSELYMLRGAKYTRSNLNNIFHCVQRDLLNGNIVLFIGTPCQCVALRRYIKSGAESLYLVDFVCHGVTDPRIWQKYVEYRSLMDNAGEKPTSINLRCKSSGWSKYRYSCKYNYKTKSVTIINDRDPYMILYINNIITQPGCSKCPYKADNRVTDITLGDFWGVWDIAPELDDDLGTSIVTIWNQKGMNLFDEIKAKIVNLEVSYIEGYKANPSMIKTIDRNPLSSKAIDKILELGFKEAYEEYINHSNSQRDYFLVRISKLIKSKLLNMIFIKNLVDLLREVN